MSLRKERLKVNSGPEVKKKFDEYPEKIRNEMLELRALIIQTAEKLDDVKELEETLKWGEPSYLVKKGSTIRIDWKAKAPDQYAIYFKCTSKLVPSFKSAFGQIFEYDGNRALIFKPGVELPIDELKDCIASALQYHKIKHLPLLGL